METTVLALDRIVPYWRNPRRIPDEAVNAVVESIRRYGYQQPIVVDSRNTIVIGHTRYAALRRLGATEAQVIVASDLSQEKIKQLRVLDNRVSEFNSWDFDKLVEEIGALDAQLMASYFPEMTGGFDDLSEVDVDVTLEAAAAGEHSSSKDPTAEFVCTHCFHTFEVPVTMKALRKGRLEVAK